MEREDAFFLLQPICGYNVRGCRFLRHCRGCRWRWRSWSTGPVWRASAVLTSRISATLNLSSCSWTPTWIRIRACSGVSGTANISSFGTYNFVGREYAPSFGFGKRLYQILQPFMPIPALQNLISNSPLINSRSCRLLLHSKQILPLQDHSICCSLDDAGIGDALVPGPAGTLSLFHPTMEVLIPGARRK